MRRKFLICCTLALVSLNSISALASVPVNSVCTKTAMSNIEPKKDDIRYQFKVINNVLYRRLYNFSTNEPVTDWEVAP
jgi:hypothetical protein